MTCHICPKCGAPDTVCDRCEWEAELAKAEALGLDTAFSRQVIARIKRAVLAARPTLKDDTYDAMPIV